MVLAEPDPPTTAIGWNRMGNLIEAALHYARVTQAANGTHAYRLRIIYRAEMRTADEIICASVFPPILSHLLPNAWRPIGPKSNWTWDQFPIVLGGQGCSCPTGDRAACLEPSL